MTGTTAAGGLGRARLVALAGAAALVPLNSTMIAVALTDVAADFERSVGGTSVLVTTYLVVMLLGQPLAGRISDRVGTDRAIRGALVTFLASSAAGAIAPTFPALVAARIGQAVSGSMLVPGVQAMLRSATPAADRGRVFGIFHSLLGVGAAAGPVVAGLLVQSFGWRAIFVINVPVVAAALAVPLARAPRGGGSVGAASPVRNATFARSFGIQALTTFSQYALLLVAPVILEDRGWRSSAVGLGLSALTVGMIVSGPLGGRAGDRRGRRFPVLAGGGSTVVAMALIAISGDGVSPAVLIAGLAVFGAGLGFASPSAVIAGIESVDAARAGAAAGTLSASRYVGSIVASVLVGAWIADTGAGSTRAFAVGTATCAAAVLLAAGLPRRPVLAQTGGDPTPTRP